MWCVAGAAGVGWCNILVPDGDHLTVGPDHIQNNAENKQESIVRGLASANENSESVAVLYKHLTPFLEEGAVKVSTTVYTWD